MTGNDHINITLPVESWRSVYLDLNRDRLNPDESKPKVNPTWMSHLQEIEKRCRNNETTIQFTVAQTWPMSATVRLTAPELAEEISRQMVAQTAWWDCAEITEESFPMDIVPIESVLVKLPDSPLQSLLDKRRWPSVPSSG